MILCSILGSNRPLVHVLEHLVETELSEALGRVANQSYVPSNGEALEPLISVDSLESVGDALVELGISLYSTSLVHYSCNASRYEVSCIIAYLFSAFDNIKRTHKHVGNTACKDATNHALAVVAHIVYVTSNHFERLVLK